MAIDVNTSSGSVRGQTLHVLNRSIHQFLNIPYAEPPLGPLRFAPPLPLRAPKQLKDMSENIPMSEDCLVLNIWTPNVGNSSDSKLKGKGSLKPVMFSIHIGGLKSGSIFRDFYNGSVLATNHVVVVSANYRVGPLGFLYGADETAPGNAGLYDQLLALKWVRKNIHSFGGNGDQMTIFGNSAGSWSVSAHILSPLSKGLFRRAIMQSGSVAFNRDRPVVSAAEALQKAKQLARRLNCAQNDDKWLDCLRAIEDPKLFVERSVNKSALVWQWPVFGTQFLPVLPNKALKTQSFNSDIEVMAGATKDEGKALSYRRIPEMKSKLTAQLFRKAVRDLSGEYHNIDVDKVCAHYLNGVHTSNSSQLKSALSALYGDLEFTCPTYRFAKRLATNGQRTKLSALIKGCANSDVCHAAELDLTYGQPLRFPKLYTKTEYDFSIDVMKMWTNFAKNGKAHELWPQLCDKSGIHVKDLNPNDMSLILDNPYESTCDVYSLIY
ncbi:unnamed protein product [Medioppia subpectinata]|uniref:Carboxylic ester hydrolase n=1 Tax=Medioppia subpectinata TaxID=1979941 RepID=A0A7R9KIW4_9ACAR|nr:unnamed protein product [Medioppia subpectinata]CAG2102998.1 unnamed protein product [Medioppia subpectinata]